MVRLNQKALQASLPQMPAAVAKPAYDRASLVPGIVHLGIGAFHRAHMAVYVDSTLAQDGHWAIIGASLRRPDTTAALQPQDYLYTVAIKDAGGSRSRIIGSVVDIVDASGDTRQLLAQMSGPTIRIVSLTVTEKGYCHDPATGALLLTHPDIMHDLAHLDRPRSVPGIIVAALALRRGRGLKGFTVLSCDNLQGNGHITRRVVTEFARLYDAGLADWIAANASFPSTMVDRIVPSTTDEDRSDAETLIGFEDAWPVVTEPFSQWVVEDDFVAGRPDFEAVGVQLVADVEPFELMKLRMLNGSHSTIAYLGLLSGFQFVAEAVADANIHKLLQRLTHEEIIPTLAVPGMSLEAYAARLLERFANPSLRHRCAQIAMDGSQKLPQRILMPIRERLARQQSVELLSLTVAAWIAFVAAKAPAGAGELADPLAARLAQAVAEGDGSSSGLVRAFFAITEIFGEDLGQSAALVAAVERHLNLILTEGAPKAIAAALAR